MAGLDGIFKLCLRTSLTHLRILCVIQRMAKRAFGRASNWIICANDADAQTHK